LAAGDWYRSSETLKKHSKEISEKPAGAGKVNSAQTSAKSGICR